MLNGEDGLDLSLSGRPTTQELKSQSIEDCVLGQR
jgi:hypothetical protein